MLWDCDIFPVIAGFCVIENQKERERKESVHLLYVYCT